MADAIVIDLAAWKEAHRNPSGSNSGPTGPAVRDGDASDLNAGPSGLRPPVALARRAGSHPSASNMSTPRAASYSSKRQVPRRIPETVSSGVAPPPRSRRAHADLSALANHIILACEGAEEHDGLDPYSVLEAVRVAMARTAIASLPPSEVARHLDHVIRTYPVMIDRLQQMAQKTRKSNKKL